MPLDVRDDEHPQGTPDRCAFGGAVQHRDHDELPSAAVSGGEVLGGVSEALGFCWREDATACSVLAVQEYWRFCAKNSSLSWFFETRYCLFGEISSVGAEEQKPPSSRMVEEQALASVIDMVLVCFSAILLSRLTLSVD